VYKPSKYQQAIYDEIATGNGNLLIEAKAGSGKTHTIVEATKLLAPSASALFVAFNKHIAEELQRRVPKNVTACTLNSFGFRVLRSNTQSRLIVDKDKTSVICWFQVYDNPKEGSPERAECFKFRPAIVKLVSLLKANSYGCPRGPSGSLGQVAEQLADQF
jgi:hypothetical protein